MYNIIILTLLFTFCILDASIHNSFSYEQGVRLNHLTAQISAHNPIFIEDSELYIDRVTLHASNLTTFYQRLMASVSYHRLSLDLFYEKGVLTTGTFDGSAAATLHTTDETYKIRVNKQNFPTAKRRGSSWETGIKLSYLIYQQESWSFYTFVGVT